MADKKQKPISSQRLSNTSLRAGKEPGLESDRSRRARLLNLPKAGKSNTQPKDLERRIIHAEKQLATAVALTSAEEEFDLQPEVIQNKMGDRKNMVVPGTRDVPKFVSSKPRELRRFIRQLEDLWKEAGITEGADKKQSLGKYADQESKEEWSALKSYGDGYTWDEFKKELLDNYPEASAAEQGTPAKIRQIVRDADSIELGDTVKLYAYRRAFLAEANKLKKPPVVMSNRELVELFMGGLSLAMGQAILQYLGTTTKKVAEKGKESKDDGKHRPEDRYDEVCRAAGEVT